MFVCLNRRGKFMNHQAKFLIIVVLQCWALVCDTWEEGWCPFSTLTCWGPKISVHAGVWIPRYQKELLCNGYVCRLPMIQSGLLYSFRQIFHVLDLMTMDMVNFTIQSLRPHLQRNLVDYERAKFQDILEETPSMFIFTVQSLWAGPPSHEWF